MAIRLVRRLAAAIAAICALATLVLVFVPYEPEDSKVGQTLQMQPVRGINVTQGSESSLSRIHGHISRISGLKKGAGTRLVALAMTVFFTGFLVTVLYCEKCCNVREYQRSCMLMNCGNEGLQCYEPERCKSGLTLCFTLLVDLLPNGFLPLPYLAQGLSLQVACALVIIFGALTAITMILIQRAASLTKQQDFSSMCLCVMPLAKIPLVTRGITRMIVFMISLNCFGNLVCYLGFAADIFKEMAGHNLHLPFTVMTLRNIGVFSSAAILIPFCLQRTLADIFGISVFGAFAVSYSLFSMIIRWCDGSYGEYGVFYDVVLHPEATETIPWLSSEGPVIWCAVLEFTNGLTVAYLSHYNAPLYGRESGDNEVYETVVLVSFAFCSLFYCTVLILVHATFGDGFIGSLQSTILNSYSPKDPLLQLARVSVAISILCSFPMMFYGLRESVLQLFAPLEVPRGDSSAPKVDSTGGSEESQDPVSDADALKVNSSISLKYWQNSMLTVFAMISVVCCTIVFDDIGVVVSFCGQVSGCVLVYLVPAGLFLGIACRRRRCCGSCELGGESGEGSSIAQDDFQFESDANDLTPAMIVCAALAGALGVSLSVVGLYKAIVGCN